MYKLLLSFLFLPLLLNAQSQSLVKGQVIDAQTNKPVAHVQILKAPGTLVAQTNTQGIFQLRLPAGNYKILFKHPAYQIKTLNLLIKNTGIIDLGDIRLQPKMEKLNPVLIASVTDFVTDDKLPVSQAHLKGIQLKDMSANNDLPGILSQAPSVYATKQGGGIGDSRINIRGFSQRNVAVLINGVPVNDMQTGWVYWSNWLNLPDITSNAQLQTGMGASKLAIPSIGGTINIITASAAKKRGGMISYDYSNYQLHKWTTGYNTGILENGLSASLQLSRIKGKGYVDMTGVDAYTYYFNLGYLTPNQKHQIMFNIIGAPQWHYQRNTAPALRDYLQYSNTSDPNIKYNSEWGYLKSKAYSWSKNYFHKPITSLNWDWSINDDWQLSSVVYAMFGRGGGSGPIGAINDHYPNDPVYTDSHGQVRFDDIHTWNSGGHVPDFGADRTPDSNGLYVNKIDDGLTRYAFMNNHVWLGGIFNVKYDWNEKINLSAGVDWRKTYGKNTLTVNNVLGADAYFDNSDVNHPNRYIYPNEFVPATYDWNPFKSIDDLSKIVFYNQANINWVGVFGQLKYQSKILSVFLQAGWSDQGFQRIDYFNLPEGRQKSNWVNIPGGNIKAGWGWQISPKHQVFANAGYFSKQPLFNAVFPNWSDNTISEDLTNEKIYAAETGYRFTGKQWQSRFNIYFTVWQDRYQTVTDIINHQQVSGLLKYLKEIHKGIEWTTQARYKAWQFYSMLSVGDWYYQGDIKKVPLYNFQQQLVTTKDYYLDGVKVGDAAQFTAFLKMQYRINRHWRLFVSQFYADKLYAKIDVSSFSNPNHQGSLRLPAYSVVDAGTTYGFKPKNTGRVKLHFSIQNLFDKKYISESHTNIHPQAGSNVWHGVNTDNRVFFGWGRTWQFGLQFNF